MIAHSENLDRIRTVAEHLGPLLERVVFLGGATTELLVTDPGAPSPRPTDDVDVIVDAHSTVEYTAKLGDELRARGFSEDLEPGAPICRWIIAGIKVDIMPADAQALGFSNRWYADAMAHAQHVELPSGPTIRLVTAPYFLATKLEAFADRGRADLAMSHDLEDIVALVDGRAELEREIAGATADLRTYLAARFAALLADPLFVDALPGFLPPDPASQARLANLVARLECLCQDQRSA